jgi:hypothetical protein
LQLDYKGLHIRGRVCAKLEPENVLALCYQLSQTLCTIPRHACLLSVLDQSLDSVRQFLWMLDCFLQLSINEIQSQISVQRISVSNSLFNACYALLRMRPLLNSWAECSVVVSAEKLIMTNLASEAMNAKCGDYV